MTRIKQVLIMLFGVALLVVLSQFTAQAATVQPTFGAHGQVFFPHEPVEIGLTVVLDRGEEFARSEPALHYSVQDFWGETLLQGALPIDPTIPGAGRADLRIELPDDARGWFRVDLALPTDEGLIPLRNPGIAMGLPMVTFAILEPPKPGPLPSSFFGMGEHHLNAENAELMRRAGIRRLRTDVSWQGMQTAKDGPIDWRRLDAIFAVANEHDIVILPIIDYTARFAAQELPGVRPGNPVHYPPEEGAWRSFVRALVERYKEMVPVWEVWNEPNAHFWLGTPAQYADLLRQAYEEIRSVDPSAMVSIGGPSGIALHWFREVVDAGGAPYFDIVAVHPYRQPRAPELGMLTDLEQITEWAKGQPPSTSGVADRPLWITEMGYHVLGNERAISEREQAEYLVRAMIKALAFGVEAFYWYEFADGTVDPSDSEANFGLTYHNLMPRPSYAAYAVMERMLGEAHSGRRIELADRSLRVYLFQVGEQELVVAWSLDGDKVVEWPAYDSVAVIDMMGRRHQFALGTDDVRATASVQLSSTPVYVEGIDVSALEAQEAAIRQAISSEPLPNLVRNSGFESGFRPPLGWAFHLNGGARFTWERRTDVAGAPEGETYLRLKSESPRAPHVYGRVHQAISVQPWTTYVLTAQVRTANNRGAWIGGGPGWATRFNLPPDTRGEWVELRAEFTTASDPTWELMILLEDVVEYVDIDDVRVIQKLGP